MMTALASAPTSASEPTHTIAQAAKICTKVWYGSDKKLKKKHLTRLDRTVTPLLALSTSRRLDLVTDAYELPDGWRCDLVYLSSDAVARDAAKFQYSASLEGSFRVLEHPEIEDVQTWLSKPSGVFKREDRRFGLAKHAPHGVMQLDYVVYRPSERIVTPEVDLSVDLPPGEVYTALANPVQWKVEVPTAWEKVGVKTVGKARVKKARKVRRATVKHAERVMRKKIAAARKKYRVDLRKGTPVKVARSTREARIRKAKRIRRVQVRDAKDLFKKRSTPKPVYEKVTVDVEAEGTVSPDPNP